MASSTATMGNLPRGVGICTSIPDILYLPELVFSYMATLLYFIHTILSAIRWKSF
ncbi:uncharacterized protein mala.2 [Limanda limanda]|uniref:uncharacterized protein mala.2 n=1 Tax=Limanda limanda TaxID=27771 RepID=UPI0029C8089C|nr:uncharacterized protein mala.2 [Limanda limanda]